VAVPDQHASIVGKFARMMQCRCAN
jgi:hypothetical protein